MLVADQLNELSFIYEVQVMLVYLPNWSLLNSVKSEPSDTVIGGACNEHRDRFIKMSFVSS